MTLLLLICTVIICKVAVQWGLSKCYLWVILYSIISLKLGEWLMLLNLLNLFFSKLSKVACDLSGWKLGWALRHQLICQINKFFWLHRLVIILVRWKYIYFLIKSLRWLRSYLISALGVSCVTSSSFLPLVFINYLSLILLRFQCSFFTLICLKLWACCCAWWV